MRAASAARVWLIVFLAVGAVVSALTWTVLRPHLYLTDGVPTATDPFTPFGVLLVNFVLVAAAWGALGVIALFWKLARR